MKGGRSNTHICYIWLIIGLGTWEMVRLFHFLDLDYSRQFLIFIALGVAAEWLAVNLPHGQLSGFFAVVLSSFLVYGAPAAVWIGALATLFAHGIVNQGNPLRVVLFSAARHVLAVMAGNYAFLWAGGKIDAGVAPEMAGALVAFAAAYCCFSHLLVYLYVSPKRRDYPMLSWWGVLRRDGLTCLFNVPAGLFMVFLYGEMGLAGVILFFILVLVVQFMLRLYVRLNLAHRDLMAFYHVARRLREKPDVQEIVELILQETRRLVSYHTGVIYLWSDEQGCYRAAAAAGYFSEELRRTVVIPGEGFIGRVLENGQPEIVYDAREDPRVKGEPGLFQVYRSLLIIPLLAGSVAVGAFILGDKRRQAFDENHMHTLSVIAGQAAVAVANTLLMRRLEEDANTGGHGYL